MESRINTKWFQDRLAEKRMSQRQLAKHMGLDSSAISLTFRGRREMKLTEAAEIAQLMGVPVDEVLHHAGVRNISKGKRVSVAKVLEANGEVRCLTGEEMFDIEAPADLLGDDWIALQARTQGGDLEHIDGWMMFLRQPRGVPSDAIGRYSLVMMRNGVMVLANVRRSYQPRRYDLIGPFSAHGVDLEWAQPIEHIRT
jgi:transcriptional regulator with XRE-family HTH domain